MAINVKTDGHDFYVICLYRTTATKTVESNMDILNVLSKLPTSEENDILLVGDVNLPHVKWDKGAVDAPPSTTDQMLQTEKKYLDLFTMKGFNWFNEDHYTRFHISEDVYQTSLLDQVFCNSDNIVNNLSFVAPFGKSDHLGVVV